MRPMTCFKEYLVHLNFYHMAANAEVFSKNKLASIRDFDTSTQYHLKHSDWPMLLLDKQYGIHYNETEGKF